MYNPYAANSYLAPDVLIRMDQFIASERSLYEQSQFIQMLVDAAQLKNPKAKLAIVALKEKLIAKRAELNEALADYPRSPEAANQHLAVLKIEELMQALDRRINNQVVINYARDIAVSSDPTQPLSGHEHAFAKEIWKKSDPLHYYDAFPREMTPEIKQFHLHAKAFELLNVLETGQSGVTLLRYNAELGGYRRLTQEALRQNIDPNNREQFAVLYNTMIGPLYQRHAAAVNNLAPTPEVWNQVFEDCFNNFKVVHQQIAQERAQAIAQEEQRRIGREAAQAAAVQVHQLESILVQFASSKSSPSLERDFTGFVISSSERAFKDFMSRLKQNPAMRKELSKAKEKLIAKFSNIPSNLSHTQLLERQAAYQELLSNNRLMQLIDLRQDLSRQNSGSRDKLINYGEKLKVLIAKAERREATPQAPRKPSIFSSIGNYFRGSTGSEKKRQQMDESKDEKKVQERKGPGGRG